MARIHRVFTANSSPNRDQGRIKRAAGCRNRPSRETAASACIFSSLLSLTRQRRLSARESTNERAHARARRSRVNGSHPLKKEGKSPSAADAVNDAADSYRRRFRKENETRMASSETISKTHWSEAEASATRIRG